MVQSEFSGQTYLRSLRFCVLHRRGGDARVWRMAIQYNSYQHLWGVKRDVFLKNYTRASRYRELFSRYLLSLILVFTINGIIYIFMCHCYYHT